MFRDRLAAIIGNFLEHYDSALFGLLAPFIAPLFFPQSDSVMALILTYSMMPLGLLTRPLGALFFGWIGDRIGRKEALFYSLLGMSIATMSMGFLPFYPPLLALGRMLQSFCAAGESTGGAIFVLEHTKQVRRSLMSSFYDISSMGGILCASLMVTLCSYHGSIETSWRLLFWASGATALLGFFLRLTAKESLHIGKNPEKEKKIPLLPLLSIILASGFSHVTYNLTFTFMNGYIPLITSLSKTDILQSNTYLLLLDLGLLPIFGLLAHRWGKEKVMLLGSVGACMSGIPLFLCLDQASFFLIALVRIALIILGVAFAAPYHAWSLEQVSPEYRYRLLSLGNALGSQLIGAPSAALCLWLYEVTKWSASPGLYLSLAGISATLVLYPKALQKSINSSA